MKVSIVIPAYNEEAYIEATIQAALKQDYPDFEIIVVDNGSSDKTFELAQKTGVKVVIEKRKGTQWARERGRQESKGEIIANLDADCLPDIDWVSKGVKSVSAKGVVAVTGAYDYFDGAPFFRTFSLFGQRTVYFSMNFILQKFDKGAVLIGGNAFFRADALDKAGGYNTDIVFYGDDTDTAKRMATQGKVVFDRNLSLKSSARRLKSQGILKITFTYIYYFFKTILQGKKH